MGSEFPITAADEWHFGERKSIDIRVTDEAGDPVDLTTIEMSWRVARTTESARPYIEKNTTLGEIEPVAADDDVGGVKSIARCQVERDDYDLFPRKSGLWRHELVDDDTGLVLSYGPARILPSIGLAVVSS